MTQNVIATLRERGFIDAVTDEEVVSRCDKPMRVYIGFDPTADSLHLGNLVAIMGLAWFQKHGHTPVALVGGATGLVGDPSGKSHERPLLDQAAVEQNLKGITKNLQQVLDFDHPTAKPVVVNNYDWFQRFGYIEFLRDIGKYFRMGPMLARESVKARLNSEEGLSYTEFSYQCLQAYDFLHLFDEHGVRIQMGGSDQWGNITAGTELVRRVRAEQVFGVTFPLLTRTDGKKFGKSEKGAIWLSPERLSPYEFYQYLFRTPDADVIRMLQMLTFMDLQEIEQIAADMKSPNYRPNSAQQRLAEEVTRIVHGDEGVAAAKRVTASARPGADSVLDASALEAIAHEMPSTSLARADCVGQKYIDLLVTCGLQKSKGEARRLVRNGGAYLNNSKVADEERELSDGDLVDDRLLLLGVGRKTKMIVRVEA